MIVGGITRRFKTKEMKGWVVRVLKLYKKIFRIKVKITYLVDFMFNETFLDTITGC